MATALRIRPSSPADDAAQFGRRVRDIAVDGTAQLAKRVDVPHLVEVGRDNATAAVSDAVDRVTGRRRRSNPLRPLFIGGLVLTLGLGAWWFLRSEWFTTWRAMGEDDLDDDLGATVDQRPDPESLSRASDDGMATALGTLSLTADPMTPPPAEGPAEMAERGYPGPVADPF